MNSRSSVNETNLVNFSTDISTLNQLDTKDGLLSFPFDHLYACHSESSERRQSLQLDKEVEISTHCVVAEDKGVSVTNHDQVRRLVYLENQNKKLKDLLIYHLDLIQQQNELTSKREKLYQALKHENDSLKSRLNRMDRRLGVNQRHSVNPPPLVHVPTSTVTSTVVKNEPTPAPQITLNTFTDLLLPDNRKSFVFESDLNKSPSFMQDSFNLNKTSESNVSSYLSSGLGLSSLLDSNLPRNNYTMIDNKKPFKKEIKTENRSGPLYTVTSNSGNPVIKKIQRSRRKTSSSIGSFSRMSKNTVIKTEPESSKSTDDNKRYDRYSLNKKSRMINTYGKSRPSNSKRTSQFTGSLSDRLRLIDTTPTGEDPYQLGEADMREQSPIPKLMLQKSNHSRMKTGFGATTDPVTSPKLIYDSTDTQSKINNRMKMNRYHLTNTYVHPSELKPDTPKSMMMDDDQDLDIIKTEPDIDWPLYDPTKSRIETSLCDFSYGETPSNLASHCLPSLDSMEFQDLFSPDSPLNLENLNTLEYSISGEKKSDKVKKRIGRTTSLLSANFLGVDNLNKRPSNDGKGGRKRAFSTTGLLKSLKRENAQKGIGLKPKPIKGKGICRGKKLPTPGMVTRKPYHTLVGDPDLSWYMGLDPEVKVEDVDQINDATASAVEVPRWREKPYTSCYTLEGTENLDDKVFEKRHHKLEAEERRQLRWHMRRIREQRHVDRLRQRQRDSWCSGGGSPAHALPSVFTVWPQPQRDVRFIEVTDALPVIAFGEILPELPEQDFVLPWVRSSKAMKRSKRSKTLH